MAKNSVNWKAVANFIAFIGLVLLAITVTLGFILPSSIASAFDIIAKLIAYSMVAISSYYYVRTRRNVWFTVTWIVCVVLITVMIFV